MPKHYLTEGGRICSDSEQWEHWEWVTGKEANELGEDYDCENSINANLALVEPHQPWCLHL